MTGHDSLAFALGATVMTSARPAPHRDSLRQPAAGRWLAQLKGPWAAMLFVQAVTAGFLVYMRLLPLPRGIVRPGATDQLLPIDRYVPPFYNLMSGLDWLGATLGVAFLSLAAIPWGTARLATAVAWLGTHVRLVAAATAVALCGLSLAAHHGSPFTMDEYAPYFQAQIFAQGRLVAAWPPALTPLLVSPEYTQGFLRVSAATGQACSDYWPGHALLLAPFSFLGAPWALNPVLSGLAVFLVATIARAAFGPAAAGWAVLFTLASPVFTAYGISFYAMTAHLVANLLFVWLLLTPTLPRTALAGLVSGCALVLHNPFPHAVFALPWAIWLGLRPDRWTRFPVYAACALGLFLTVDSAWDSVKSRVVAGGQATPAATPADPAVDPATNLGPPPPPPAPAAEPAPAPVGGITRLLGQLRGYLGVVSLPSSFSVFWRSRLFAFLRLVAWDTPGLLVLAVCGLVAHRGATPARLLAASAASTYVAYAFVEMSGGHGWGYRYFFPAWLALPLLASSLATAPDRPDFWRGVLTTAGRAAVLSLVITLPLRMLQIHGVIADHLRQMPPRPAESEVASGNIVSFIDPRVGYFRSDLIRNHPFFDSRTLVLVSLGAEADGQIIRTLAKMTGTEPRQTHADPRGTTWVLDEGPFPPDQGTLERP